MTYAPQEGRLEEGIACVGVVFLVWGVGRGGHGDRDGEAGSRTRDAHNTWLASFPPIQSGCSVYGTVKPAFEVGLSQTPYPSLEESSQMCLQEGTHYPVSSRYQLIKSYN